MILDESFHFFFLTYNWGQQMVIFLLQLWSLSDEYILVNSKDHVLNNKGKGDKLDL